MMFVLVALMVVDIAAGFMLVVVAVGEALVLRITRSRNISCNSSNNT